MANEHSNDELQQQSSDGNSPSNNIAIVGVQSTSEQTTKTTATNLCDELPKSSSSSVALTNNSCNVAADGADGAAAAAAAATAMKTTSTAIASPDLGLGIETNSNSNNSNNNTLCHSATTTTTTTAPTTHTERSNIPTPLVYGTMRKSATTTAAPTQNASTFSFKHFLSSSSSTFTAPSTTVTSLDPICSLAAAASSNTMTTISTASTTITATSNGGFGSGSSGSSTQQKSTGARPKVPQSASLAIDAIYGGRSGSGYGNSGGDSSSNNSSGGAFGIGSSRMKRSPRFSSFDSQASLAEYVAASSSLGISNRPNRLSLHPTLPFASSNGPLAATQAQAQHGLDAAQQQQQQQKTEAACAGLDLHMDMQSQCPSASTTSLPHISSFRGAAARRSNQNLNTSSAHKLDLPIDSAAANILGPTDFPSASASAAAALPDFVQDHWMDTLYLQDMHLNSPRSSPTREFGGGGGVGISGGDGVGAMANATDNVAWSDMGAIGGNTIGGVGHNNNGCGGVVGSVIGCDNIGGDVIATAGCSSVNAAGASKMLPDFLSDGPIIHSSQRLADVAAGLPSNSVGSPEDPPITSQLSNLRLENERLQRELSELRTALCEQTRRANDLERQMEEENRQRRTTVTPTAQQILRLKQQLAEVTEEAEILRRENENLREEGAVGGLTTETATNPSGQRTTDDGFVRPISSTRSQQISQALLRAASNAENNLRQLLAGVDNLRQMAADIEGPGGLRLDNDGNSDMYSDFLDDCDGFEDFSGGPAL